MKKMMVAVCAMVAAFAGVADGATRSPRFLGFALGDKVDAAVCKARGLSARESTAGTMAFEVNYGTKSVEVSLASAAPARLSAELRRLTEEI
jgi:hypothetical protein